MADLSGVKVGDVLRIQRLPGYWRPDIGERLSTVARITPKFAVTDQGEKYRISDGGGYGWPAHIHEAFKGEA